jgi:hypothetical protein
LVSLSRSRKSLLVAAILPSFRWVVKVLHDRCYSANTAAPVSLFLMGLRRTRFHPELIGGAVDPSAPSIQDMRVDHRRADIPMTQRLLDRPDIVTLF